jgi:exonuclease III
MRIATWNLWRPKNSFSERSRVLRDKIDQVNADIWILTETHREVGPSVFVNHHFSDPIVGLHHAGECRTAIWSKYPTINIVETYDPCTALCVELDSPLGGLLVYGTVIPYGQAGLKHPYWFNCRKQKATSSWELHYEAIAIHQRELSRLKQAYPNHKICVAGDFNVSLDGHRWGTNRKQWYGTAVGRSKLIECLSENRLELSTKLDFVDLGMLATRSNVDHICLSHELAERVDKVYAWETPTMNEKKASDHNGVHLDVNE